MGEMTDKSERKPRVTRADYLRELDETRAEVARLREEQAEWRKRHTNPSASNQHSTDHTPIQKIEVEAEIVEKPPGEPENPAPMPENPAHLENPSAYQWWTKTRA